MNYGVRYTSDRINNSNAAALFNGSGNYLSVPNNASINFVTGDFSIFTIIKTSVIPTYSWNAIVTKHNLACWHDADYYLQIDGATGRPIFGLSTNYGLFENVIYQSNICDNNYHSLCGVRENRVLKFYVDGELVGSLNSTINADNSNPLNIGRSSYNGGQGYFPGVIDEVRMYNRALSQQEIRNLF